MKTNLKISIFLNLLLLGELTFIWQSRRNAASTSIDPAPVPVVAAAVPPPQITAKAEPPPFRWSQLNSTNYHIFVKNLRGIGCPEPTVRAIVTADVDAVYRRIRTDLEQKLAASASNSWSHELAAAGAEPALRAELQHLPEEETWLIDGYLGLPHATNPAAVVTTQPPPVRRPNQPAAGPPVTTPLVFQNFDPAELGLSDDQVQMITSLRQNFMEQIGGASQDPNDPAYLARWQQAQPALDNMLLGMLGSDVYVKFQMLQLMAANQETLQTPQN
jgi:hypothetical protein